MSSAPVSRMNGIFLSRDDMEIQSYRVRCDLELLYTIVMLH